MVRNTELWGFLFLLGLACGESKQSGDDETGGSSSGGASSGGASSGGASSGGASSGSSGTASGGTTAGGAGGTTAGGTTSGGTASGGASGSGAVSGSAGTAGAGGWSAACGDVTHNGRCVGNVYQWCDYFEQGIREMDCGARGMTCRASESINTEDDSNGCYDEGACTAADERCDGQFVLQCQSGGLQALDCRKNKGALSQCEEATTEIPYPRCGRDTPCGGNASHCDGNMLFICDEDGRVYLQNCAQRVPSGRCVENGTYPDCDPPLIGG
jgi:hypothetical protein